jgi:hypothetical protein
VQERGKRFRDEIICVQTEVIKKLYEVNTVLKITIVALRQRVEQLDGERLMRSRMARRNRGSIGEYVDEEVGKRISNRAEQE